MTALIQWDIVHISAEITFAALRFNIPWIYGNRATAYDSIEQLEEPTRLWFSFTTTEVLHNRKKTTKPVRANG